MKNPQLLALLAATSVAASCAHREGRVVDGGLVDDDGWPVRPADDTLRCPDGTDLVDVFAPTGRRMVTCQSMGNPVPRGFQLTWNEMGTLVSRFEFTDDGVPLSRTRWFDDGTKAAEALYEDGQLVTRKTWYSNGEKKSVTVWDGNENVLSLERFDPDGSLAADGQTQEGKKVGIWREWRDGAMVDINYVEGVPEGDVLRRYPSGGTERGSYEAGKKHGEWVRKDQNGGLVREMSYNYGKKSGPYRLYHPNTQLREEGQYLNGKKHGQWKTWHPSGQLQSEAWYACGTPVGPFHLYFPDGAPRKVGTYENGRNVGEWKTYNDSGVVTRVEQYDAPTESFDPENLPDSCPDPAETAETADADG